MKKNYTFKFNGFTNVVFYLLMIIIVIPFYVFDVSMLWILPAIAIVMLLTGIVSQRIYLTIDEVGITIHRFMGSDEMVTWSLVGDFKSNVKKGSGKSQQTGFAVIPPEKIGEKAPEEYDDTYYNLFINSIFVAAPDKDVETALRNSIDYYVNGKKSVPTGWGDEDNDLGRKLLVIFLILISFGMFLYFYLVYKSLMPDEHLAAMSNTLINGSDFFSSLHNYDLFLFLGAIIVVMLTPTFFIKKNYIILCVMYLLAIAVTSFMVYNYIPKERMILQNCSEATTNPVDSVVGKVTENNPGGRRQRSYLQFEIVYEGQRYLVERGYQKDIKVGTPVVTRIQKGSKGLPIMRDYTILSPLQKEQDEQKDNQDLQAYQKIQKSSAYAEWHKAWAERSLRIDGRDYGQWIVLESVTIEEFGKPEPLPEDPLRPHLKPENKKYHMLLALHLEAPQQVLMVIGNHDETEGFKSKKGRMDKTIRVWAGQQSVRYHPIENASIANTWLLNDFESKHVIPRLLHNRDITVVVNQIDDHILCCFTFEDAKHSGLRLGRK
jgi:hypothetical protein